VYIIAGQDMRKSTKALQFPNICITLAVSGSFSSKSLWSDPFSLKRQTTADR
jgi:hypothetical protein